MKRQSPARTGFRMAVLVLAWLFATPLSAQDGATLSPRFRDHDGERRERAEPRPAPARAPAPAPDSSAAERRRAREGQPQAGTAVPRESVPRPKGGTTVIVPSYTYRNSYPHSHYGYGYYPWGSGGLGFGDYYDGAYDPWWYAGYPSYGQSGAYGSSFYEGSLHLKMKPRHAQVYVDGYYAGVVDDFDGIFQRLQIEAGPHRIEVRAPGYETVRFDVQIAPDRKTTYRGDLRAIP